jgi:hypothetical protein
MNVKYRRLFRSSNPLLRFVGTVITRSRHKLPERGESSEATFRYALLLIALVQLPAAMVSYLLSPGLDSDLMFCSSLAGVSSFALEISKDRSNRIVSTAGLLAINVSLGVCLGELIPISFIALDSLGVASSWIAVVLGIAAPIFFAVAMAQDLEYAEKFACRGFKHCVVSALSCSLFFSAALPFVWIARILRLVSMTVYQ